MVVTDHNSDPVPGPEPESPEQLPEEETPMTPPNTNTGKQQHGNPQIAICAGGSLGSTPGAVLP